jgi:DNA-binding NarL/FixJ family response regulator
MRSWSDSGRASAFWRRGSPALAAEERIPGPVADGKPSKEIDDELDPVEKTVKNYAWRAWSQ